ncbi:MAG: IclR family transcriptional regulator [Candidatus Acidiferrales bacterium]
MTRRLPRARANSRAPLARSRYSAPALDKGLDILEVFASEPAGLTGTEVARRLGRSVSEIFRMLVCLERRGYICEADSADRFELTLKLFELAHRRHPLERLVAHARPLLHEVAHRTGQSCHLAMLSDGAIIVVAQVDAPGSMGFSLRLGAQVDLFDTASGHVILAFQSVSSRRRALAAWERRSRRRVPQRLEKHLQAIRAHGHEEMPSYQVHGVVNISYPIFNQHGEAIAAMSVPFIERVGDRLGPKQIKDSLQAASGRLTAGIGGKRTPLLPVGGRSHDQG